MNHEAPVLDKPSGEPVSILFVCHGNICRSTMAEFVMRDMASKRGSDGRVSVASAATRNDEIGNDTHWGTKRVLDEHGIPYTKRRARRIRPQDYEDFDLIIGMDKENLRDLMRFFHDDPEGKVSLLLDWTGIHRNVADPWYTGDFDVTYEDVTRGCDALLNAIEDSS